eukprot:CAMPEP_0180019766 /NCGR_PEP_ID=MMETSP0984-20121128/21303_1 /TAXON_ID=483367 /ORGANISM="non described non described, Strain CCMP 2436" /LENGTH=47 /DNA_ID= /DNA_START= /DNA_END= /DNA_ORIENTATION=
MRPGAELQLRLSEGAHSSFVDLEVAHPLHVTLVVVVATDLQRGCHEL